MMPRYLQEGDTNVTGVVLWVRVFGPTSGPTFVGEIRASVVPPYTQPPDSQSPEGAREGLIFGRDPMVIGFSEQGLSGFGAGALVTFNVAANAAGVLRATKLQWIG